MKARITAVVEKVHGTVWMNEKKRERWVVCVWFERDEQVHETQQRPYYSIVMRFVSEKSANKWIDRYKVVKGTELAFTCSRMSVTDPNRDRMLEIAAEKREYSIKFINPTHFRVVNK